MDRGKWEIRGEVRKWTDVPLQKVSQSTDGNLLWSVVYISDTACLRVGAADDTQPALADPHLLRRPWPVTGGYAAGVP
jgi:hypothetical protein